jgi:hypothetical protein
VRSGPGRSDGPARDVDRTAVVRTGVSSVAAAGARTFPRGSPHSGHGYWRARQPKNAAPKLRHAEVDGQDEVDVSGRSAPGTVPSSRRLGDAEPSAGSPHRVPCRRYRGLRSLAAADADAIVTLNVTDFESRVLRDAGVDILTPGALVGRLLDEVPDVVTRAARHMADRWTNPPRTSDEIAELLAAHPTMAAPMAVMRKHLGG